MSEPETCPYTDTVKQHSERMASVNTQLRDVIEPLTRLLRSDCAERLHGDNEILSQVSRTYELPYGRIGMVPPAVLGDISDTTAQMTHSNVLPTDTASIHELADCYTAWAYSMAESGAYEVASFPSRESIVMILGRLKGQIYRPDDWQRSAEATRDALRDEPVFLIDAHRLMRINNAAYDHDELPPELQSVYRQHASYVLAMTSQLASDGLVSETRDLAQIPIGAYGRSMADKLAKSAIIAGRIVDSSEVVDEHIDSFLSGAEVDSISELMARPRELRGEGVDDYIKHGLKQTVAEGMLSIVQVVAFLSAEKVPGYESDKELVMALLDSPLIERFTRSVYMGYIGPATLSGLYLPGVLMNSEKGLMLNPELMEGVRSFRKTEVARAALAWAQHQEAPDEHPRPDALGMTCPAAHPKGSMHDAKQMLKMVYASL